jgi:hypothetical protein
MPGGGNGLRQVAFRGRNDDGSETTATWKAAKNTNWAQRPDRVFRVRLVIDGTKLFFGAVELWYRHNGGGLVEVTTSSGVLKAVPTVNYAHADDSTQQVGSGAFFTNNFGMVSNNGTTSGDFHVTDDEPLTEAEAEWSLQIVGDDVADGDTIQMEARRSGALGLSEGYLEKPIVTVDVPRTIRRTIIIE